MNIDALQTHAQEAAKLLSALSNEKRLLILCQLVGGERSVGDLAPQVGLSQSALSQHLARLRRDGLVKTRRRSQMIFYALASAEAEQVIATLHHLYCAVPGNGAREP